MKSCQNFFSKRNQELSFPLPDEIVGCIILPYLGPDIDKIWMHVSLKNEMERMLTLSLIGTLTDIQVPQFVMLLLRQNSWGVQKCLWKSIRTRASAKVVQYFVEQNADIHIQGELPLREASHRGQSKVVKFLLQQKANVHAQAEGALIEASCMGHANVVKVLVEHQANIHVSKNYPLRCANFFDRLDVVKILVDSKVDVNAW